MNDCEGFEKVVDRSGLEWFDDVMADLDPDTDKVVVSHAALKNARDMLEEYFGILTKIQKAMKEF